MVDGSVLVGCMEFGEGIEAFGLGLASGTWNAMSACTFMTSAQA